MTIPGRWKLLTIIAMRLVITVPVALLVLATPSSAATVLDFHATFVEPAGGPVNTPFECPPGTSCGTANLGLLGHGSSVVAFGACGPTCSIRTITLVDGSQLVIFEFADISGFASPGNSGEHGYTAFGLPGNPQFLAVTLTVMGGNGVFEGASGTATGAVKVAGGVAIITVSGTIILP
jgi:hypothetical protein